MSELWEIEGRENEPSYFGWLNTSIPTYRDTLNLKTNVQTRPIGLRPLVELQKAITRSRVTSTKGSPWSVPAPSLIPYCMDPRSVKHNEQLF